METREGEMRGEGGDGDQEGREGGEGKGEMETIS